MGITIALMPFEKSWKFQQDIFLTTTKLRRYIMHRHFRIKDRQTWPVYRFHWVWVMAIVAMLGLAFIPLTSVECADVKQVPFWDGETSAMPDGLLINHASRPLRIQ
jgi:hypothetical protein